VHINVEKQPKSTIKLTITVPNEVVKKTYEQVLDKLIKDTEVQGFRKGMAPKEKVLEKTDINKLYGEVINELLQANYVQAIKEHQIAPVSNPRVEIKEFHLDKDFEFTAVVPVRPEVKVGDYRKALKEAHDKKDEEDKKLNADRLAKGETLADTHTHLTPNEVVGIINVSSIASGGVGIGFSGAAHYAAMLVTTGLIAPFGSYSLWASTSPSRT